MWQHSTTGYTSMWSSWNEISNANGNQFAVFNPFLVVIGYHFRRYYLFQIYIFISVTLNRKDTAWSSQLEYLQQSNWHQITFIVLRSQLFPTCAFSTNGQVTMESQAACIWSCVCVCVWCIEQEVKWVDPVSSSTTAIRTSLKVTLLWSTNTGMMKPACRSQESSCLL